MEHDADLARNLLLRPKNFLQEELEHFSSCRTKLVFQDNIAFTKGFSHSFSWTKLGVKKGLNRPKKGQQVNAYLP